MGVSPYHLPRAYHLPPLLISTGDLTEGRPKAVIVVGCEGAVECLLGQNHYEL